MPDRQAFKKAKNFQTFFVSETFHYQVDAIVPDLTKSAEHCWGDWGPMYTLTLAEEQTIRITYRSASRGLEATYELHPTYVELNSPMFAQDRDRFPFYLEFEDEDRGLRFMAYFNHEAELDHAEVEKLNPDIAIDELIFGERGQKLSA